MTNRIVPKFPMVEKIGKAPLRGVIIMAIYNALFSLLANRNRILLMIKMIIRNILVNIDLDAASI